MSIEQKSENPFIYIDKDTGLEVPVRRFLDINTGETIIFTMYEKALTPVHIPKKAAMNRLWMMSLGYAEMINPLEMREIKDATDLNNLKSASTKESGAIPIWSA